MYFDKANSRFDLEVINVPGDGHDVLSKLSDDEVASIFEPGVQLSATKLVFGNQAQVIRNESSGNGAWIMQKCAEALGGKCIIRFDPDRTVFHFSCPADSYESDNESFASDDEEFCLPENTWGVVIDDSSIQRKIMDRFLKMAGIPESRRLILGSDSSEVYGFCEYVVNLMKEYPDDKVLLIADENLDIVDGGATHQTVSGSLCVQKLRQQLDYGAERRLLALIRSANDSASDLELYKARAHGFLLKEPMRKGKVLDAIKPYWTRRFLLRGSRSSSSFSQNLGDDSLLYGPSTDDIRGSLVLIDALLFTNADVSLASRWRAIREKLHALKGDLKTMKSKEALQKVEDRIDELINCSLVPENFIGLWDDIKLQIEALL